MFEDTALRGRFQADPALWDELLTDMALGVNVALLHDTILPGTSSIWLPNTAAGLVNGRYSRASGTSSSNFICRG